MYEPESTERNGHYVGAIEKLGPEYGSRRAARELEAAGGYRPAAVIIDDDASHNRALSAVLEGRGFEVTVCRSSDAAREFLAETTPRVVFLALDIDGDGELDLLDHPGLEQCEEILLMDERDTPRKIRDGMSRGAGYFLAKPFDETFLSGLLQDLLEWPRRPRQRDRRGTRAAPLDQFGELRGSSRVMRELFRVLRKVAAVNTSVLLTGESGTGKDLAARTLHRFSRRADGPFIAKNCAAIPPDLCESELFGHEKGSFSGATRCHRGLFEQADGGTLFLDEITEMPPEHQVKLLRVLENRTYRRVGGEAEMTSDVRIITASNRDPEEAIADGSLRRDLYYRIARFPIAMPPLRQRGEDIAGLARYFLDGLNERERCAKTISSEALQSLARYPFPGNVRELQSLVERAFLLAPSVIRHFHLPPLTAEAAVAGGDHIRVRVGASVYEAEKALILATLQQRENDKAAAAETLGISLRTLYNRLNAYAAEENRAS